MLEPAICLRKPKALPWETQYDTSITSNLVFSQWDRIFKDPMTTAAAIDRIIHHCVILELNGTSYRAEAAKARMPQAESTTA